jgi:hypothetical protein
VNAAVGKREWMQYFLERMSRRALRAQDFPCRVARATYRATPAPYLAIPCSLMRTQLRCLPFAPRRPRRSGPHESRVRRSSRQEPGLPAYMLDDLADDTVRVLDAPGFRPPIFSECHSAARSPGWLPRITGARRLSDGNRLPAVRQRQSQSARRQPCLERKNR